MNKIYKVVWNKARNCYVVASEFAKNHSTSSVTKKKVSIAAILAAGMLSGFSPMVSGAANITDTKTSPTMIGFEQKWDTDVANGKLSTSINGYQYQGNSLQLNKLEFIKGKNNKGQNSLTIRLGAYVEGVNKEANIGFVDTNTKNANLSTTIDNKTGEITSSLRDSDGQTVTSAVNISEYVKGKIADSAAVIYDQNKTSLKSTNSNSVGKNAIALGKGASAVDDSIAIGKGAYTQDGNWTKGQSVALGNGAVTGAKSTSIGSNAIGGREGTITIGANANNGAVYATIIGTDSKLNYVSRTSGAASTMIGAKNEIKNDDKRFSGVANGILGASNTIENSNGVTIQGSANTVTNAYRDMAPTYQTGEERYNLGGVSVKKDTGAVGILGGMNKVSNQVYTNVIGFGNTLSGNEKISSHDVFLAGSRNKLTNISDALVMGNDNIITGQAEVISLGNQTQITANQATAIGNKTVVSADGGVAIGTNSVADRVVKEGSAGAFAPDTIPNGEKSIWTATAGAVSVGNANKNITRQITNVAAGSEDTDAVNVAQLRQVNSKADSATEMANKGWNLTTAHGETTTVKPGDTVDFSPEDTNLTVTNEGTNVKIGLNQGLHLTSATFGDTTINANGLTIGHGTAGLEFSQNRVSVGGQQIHDVADGKDDADAVNMSQLKKAADSAKTTVVAGKNIKVDADTKEDGHTEYNVSLDDDITLGDKASNEFVTVSGTKGTIWAGHSVSAGTVIMDGDSGTITGLTNTTWNGTTDNLSRAATEGQLKQVADAATSNDKRLVQNPNDSDGSYQVKENGDVTLRVEDSNKNGYNVTIKDVASKAELDKVKTDVGNVDGFHDEIKNKDTNGKPTHTSVVDAVNNLDTKVNTIQSDVTKATEEAKKHSSVSTGNGLDLDVTDNNGQKDYKVSLKDDFTLGGKDGHTGSIEFKGSEGNITASGTLTANAVSVGNTSISDTGLQIGNKTSLTEDALTIGGNTYITDKGIDANQQKISNVADGDISKDSKDAVNGSQLYATNEAIANNYNNITNLNGRISNLDNRVNKVGAGAAALAALHPLDFDPDAKWDFAAGYGNYRGANAAAVGAYYRPNEDTMFSVGGTFGNGENMVNAGVSFKLGSGSSHVSTSRVAMAKEIKELRGELEAMKSAMLDANAGKKIDTSKLQLFPDVPQNHWAYEYVAQLAGNGMIEGYPDGNFAGDRPMTRYEFAAILYRAMTKGAVLSDKILSEFSHELEYFTVDTIAKDKAGNPTIQRVRTVKENKNK